MLTVNQQPFYSSKHSNVERDGVQVQVDSYAPERSFCLLSLMAVYTG